MLNNDNIKHVLHTQRLADSILNLAENFGASIPDLCDALGLIASRHADRYPSETSAEFDLNNAAGALLQAAHTTRTRQERDNIKMGVK